MTRSVIRVGTLKSHVLLNATHMAALKDLESKNFGFVLNTLAH